MAVKGGLGTPAGRAVSSAVTVGGAPVTRRAACCRRASSVGSGVNTGVIGPLAGSPSWRNGREIRDQSSCPASAPSVVAFAHSGMIGMGGPPNTLPSPVLSTFCGGKSASAGGSVSLFQFAGRLSRRTTFLLLGSVKTK